MPRSDTVSRAGAPGWAFVGSWEQRALVWLAALKIAGVVLYFDPTMREGFSLAKSQLSRGFEWLLCAILILAIARHGSAILPWSRLHIAVGAVAVSAVAAVVGAADGYLALYGDADRYLGLTFLGDSLVLYVALAIGARRAVDYFVVLAVASVAGLAAMGYGVIQYLGADPVRWTDPVGNRPMATFGNPGVFGQWLTDVVAGAAALAVLSARSAARRAVGSLGAVATAGYGALALAMASLVASRSTFLGLVAAGIALVLVTLRVGRPSARTLRLTALAATAAGLMLVLALAVTPLGERVLRSFGGVELDDRRLLYGAALRATADRPLLGWGPDNFGVAYRQHQDPRFETLIVGAEQVTHNNAHSWLLQMLVTTGIVGTATFVVALALCVRLLWVQGLRVAPLRAGVLLTVLVGHLGGALTTVGSPATDWVPWAVLGLTVPLVGRPAERPLWRGARLPRMVWAALAVALLAVALIGASFGRNAIAADRDAFRAQLLIPEHRADAIALARLAIQEDPGRGVGWGALGVALYADGRFPESADAFVEATRRSPHDSTHWQNLARALTQVALRADESRGGRAAALAAARHAVEVYPNESSSHAVLAETANVLGQPELALREAVATLRLYPRNELVGGIAINAAGLVEPRLALDLLEEVITLRDSVVPRDSVALQESIALHLTAAQVCERLGDTTCERRHLVELFRLDSGNADAWRLRDRLGG